MPNHYVTEPLPSIQRPPLPRPNMMPMTSIAGAFGGPMPNIGAGLFSKLKSIMPQVASALGTQMRDQQTSRRDRLRNAMRSQPRPSAPPAAGPTFRPAPVTFKGLLGG